jgi:hypothetical protein
MQTQDDLTDDDLSQFIETPPQKKNNYYNVVERWEL